MTGVLIKVGQMRFETLMQKEGGQAASEAEMGTLYHNPRTVWCYEVWTEQGRTPWDFRDNTALPMP